MLGPLVVLAAGCFVVGHVHVPAFVHPVLRLPEAAEVPEPAWVTPVAVLSALVGIASAFYLYVVYVGVPEKVAKTFRPLYRLFGAKYYFDDVYNAFAARVVVDGSSAFLWKQFDAGLIDGLVNGAGSVAEALSRRVRLVQTGLVRGYALVILGGAVALLGYLLWLA